MTDRDDDELVGIQTLSDWALIQILQHHDFDGDIRRMVEVEIAQRKKGGSARNDGRASTPSLGLLRRNPGGGQRGGFGRKPKLAHQLAVVRARREAGEALSDIGRSFDVSNSTISRL